MKQDVVREGLWSPLRWLCLGSVVFLVQIASIWLLNDRRVTVTPARPFETSITLQPGLYDGASVLEEQEPAFLALPNIRGFSGEAWLKYQPPQHRLTEWSEPPRWLSLSSHVAKLGEAVSAFAANNQPPVLRVADQPLPWNSAAEAPVSPLPLPRQSQLEFAGNILLDASLQPPLLPSWQSNEAVSNSIVRVAFDHRGHPFSCVLLSKSGLKEADDYALRLAMDLRYRSSGLEAQEMGAETLRFGRLAFQWHTTPVPAIPRGVTSLP